MTKQAYLPLQKSLLRRNFLILSASLAVFAVSLIVISSRSTIKTLRKEITATGIILAHSIETPLLVKDFHKAEKVLTELASDNEGINSITVYNEGHRILATYRNIKNPLESGDTRHSLLYQPSFTFKIPLQLKGSPAGYLIINATSLAILDQIQLLFFSSTILLALILPFSWTVMKYGTEQKLIPLARLEEALKTAEEQNYTINSPSKDENDLAPIYSQVNLLIKKLEGENREKEAIIASLNEQHSVLATVISKRTDELDNLHLELLKKEKLATLGQIIASVSHELRNPLGTIVSSLFTIAQNAGDDNETVTKAIARSQKSIKRCVNIIEELLDYTRVSDLKLTPLHFDSWLRQVIEDFRLPETVTLIASLNCEAEVDIQPERLQRVIDNLLTNASQAFNDSLLDTKPSILISSIEEDTQVKLEIKDNGCGMEERTLAQIFEPLFSTKNFGVGLGLPIVKQVIEAHNGQIKIESVLNQGTTITIILPKSSTAKEMDVNNH